MITSTTNNSIKILLQKIEEYKKFNSTTLDLSNLKLTSIPENTFSELNNLKVLFLYNNSLSSIPENVFKGLNNLKELYLSNNSLSSIPENIFQELNNLEYLYLYNNSLSSIPENSFKELNNLKFLYLDIDKTSFKIKSLPNIENLKLNGYPLSQFKQTIQFEDNKEIIKTHSSVEDAEQHMRSVLKQKICCMML